MVRTRKVGRPTAKEIRWLRKCMMDWLHPCQRRRAEALTFNSIGLQPLEIARAQGVHPKTVYQDLHAFEQLGAEAIQLLRSRGAPSRITASRTTKMVQLAEQSPQEVGSPFGRWSLRKLSAYLVKQHFDKSLSPAAPKAETHLTP